MTSAPTHLDTRARVGRGQASGGAEGPPALRPLRVVVVGQGYVGLPLAVRAAQMGHLVVGFDSSAERVEALAAGRSPVEDISGAQLGPLMRAGNYLHSCGDQDLAGFEVAVIAVPTPLALATTLGGRRLLAHRPRASVAARARRQHPGIRRRLCSTIRVWIIRDSEAVGRRSRRTAAAP